MEIRGLRMKVRGLLMLRVRKMKKTQRRQLRRKDQFTRSRNMKDGVSLRPRDENSPGGGIQEGR